MFDGENIPFDASLVLYIYIYIYINSINIPPIMIINRIYETQYLLSLSLVSLLVGLRTYQLFQRKIRWCIQYLYAWKGGATIPKTNYIEMFLCQ